MAGADVTISYEFLPTETSIRKSAEKVVAQLNKTVGKPITIASGKRLKSEFDKTTDSIINLLRATQQKTSLQTKILSGMKFLEGKGITGGVGGAVEGGVAGGIGGGGVGGMLGALGTIAALLVVIAVAMALISAFFEAVGPILKVVLKMISAMILILLMPFLKRGLPVLFGILKWMIQMSKGISDFADKFMTYFEKLFGRVLAGDPMAIIELMIGPIGMLGLFLAKKLVEFLASVDWNAIIRAITPLIESAFEIIKTLINNFGLAVFGEETWGKIKAAIRFIQTALAPEGLWQKVKDAVDYIGTEVFGEGVWKTIKDALGTATDGVIAKFISIRDKLGEILAGLINFYNINLSWIPGLGRIQGTSIGGGFVGGGGLAGGGGGGGAGDFISRPGFGMQKFSASDTIIGTKTPGALGGVHITNHLTVSAGVDKNEFRKILSELNRQQARDLRTRTSYFGGAFA